MSNAPTSPDTQPFPARPHHEWGDRGIIPAEVWLWQAGDVWAATNANEIRTWWDGADDEDRDAAPRLWIVPIDVDPRTVRPGVLRFVPALEAHR